MEVHVKYLSSGVNQTPVALQWGPDGRIVYAGSTGVLLYDPKDGRIIGASTKVHSDKVTCAQWVHPAPSSGPTLVTTGADSKAVVWTVSEEEKEGLLVLHPKAILDHESFVPLCDATTITEDGKEKIVIATVSTERLSFWVVCPQTGEFECLSSSTPPGRSFILKLKFCTVEGAKYPLLLCGNHDSRIYIMTAKELGKYVPTNVLNGHEDWVMALDFMKEDNGDMLLASGSKDASVRLWKFTILKDGKESQEIAQKEEEVLKLKCVIFEVPSDKENITLSVALDAILAGHEGLVSGVHWARTVTKDDQTHQPYRLLTCSKTQDRSIIIWEPEGGAETGSGIWLEVARLGEVGGNMEGYYCCQFSPDGMRVMGCSYQGGLHLWENQSGVWEPCVVVGGHFDQVVDIAWDPLGRYLLSASKDQTTRLHAPWRPSNGKEAWHEIGRPQVHGYDMACIARLGKFRFASGAEEKVVRGFAAPANFIRNFGQICSVNVEDDLGKCKVGEGASVPSLGLSNKAVTITDLQEEQQIQEEGREEVQAYFKLLSLTAPPTEDQLMQNTLWPEGAKLYGHGNDLIALAANADGSLLASSCKASHEMDAHIILWDTNKWHQVDVLAKHRLTVTQMAFSPNDEFLLSVSRDRTWTVFKKEVSPEGTTYKVSDFSKKKESMHGRVIWSCAWMPDSQRFITASRDKTVGVWCQDESGWVREALLSETNEVTAVDVIECRGSGNGDHLVATGLVNGEIHLRTYSIEKKQFAEEAYNVLHHHYNTVRRLQFSPAMDDGSLPLLASCGDDRGVRIFKIQVPSGSESR
ncbi:elongator complex protein 2-like isoform X2 [Penaeus japonicus]|uniref:elongator complex protein 2-like isoform X2 n=1 Tax=Penaeus japonicus TaxID=27405 RepID=UPI001C70D831|nr:elongator complex protein 2-like isoform X2 [Penaeus japonicus]